MSPTLRKSVLAAVGGSAYTTYETRRFVKTMKEDYIAFMPKQD